MLKTTVRLITRGKEHPYVIAVTTPGWRGVDAAFEEGGKGVWAGAPKDLKQVAAILKEAKVKPCKTLLMADGDTEFVMQDRADPELVVRALVSAGWLTPVKSAAGLR